jgi:acetyl-CoA synthetase
MTPRALSAPHPIQVTGGPAAADPLAPGRLRNDSDYRKLYDELIHRPDAFWGRQAREPLHWRRPFELVLEWNCPHAKYFQSDQLNVSENCLDRHLATFRANKATIIFEGEPGDGPTLTYRQLHCEVCCLANALGRSGAKPGDRVGISPPMIPEAVLAMLACARLGLVHTVIFVGFFNETIKNRVNDCEARLIITADAGWRRGKVIASTTRWLAQRRWNG